MATLYFISRIVFYLAAYSLAFLLNFSYAYFCNYFKKKYKLETIESNVNQIGKSLFSSFEFSTDYHDLTQEERWLTYFIVTVPTLAVCIRCTYYDYNNTFTGLYVLNWQLIIHVAAFLLAMYRYKTFSAIVKELPLNKLLESSLRKEEVHEELEKLLTESELTKNDFGLLKVLNEKFTRKKVFF